MFWSNKVQAQAIQTMLTHSGMYMFRNIILFKNGEMTAEFSQIYKKRSALAHGERVMMQVALDLWNGRGRASFADLQHLDERPRHLVFTLYEALCDSEQAVMKWIQETSRTGRS